MRINKKLVIDVIGKTILIVIFSALAFFVIAATFFPQVLPSVDKDPTLDPTYDIH